MSGETIVPIFNEYFQVGCETIRITEDLFLKVARGSVELERASGFYFVQKSNSMNSIVSIENNFSRFKTEKCLTIDLTLNHLYKIL